MLAFEENFLSQDDLPFLQMVLAIERNLKKMSEFYMQDDIVLHLNYSGIKELSDRDFYTERFRKAQYLYLKRNLVKTLPSSISQLSAIKQLHLEGNSLESLPNEIGDLKCLQVLNVVSNNLTHIPGSVGNLKTLKKLQISNNHLLYLPDELGNLHQLETLEASGNQLTNVPTSLVHCSNLKLLALDKNRLNVFPRQLCQLKNLTELSLAGNLLEYLPPVIFEGLSALNLLVIDKNPSIIALPPHQEQCLVSHCGLSLRDVVISDRFRHLNIEEQLIAIPEEIVECCKPSESCVPCLQELTLRKVHCSLRADFGELHQLLPRLLTDRLQYPTCQCLHCKKALFRSAFPIVYSCINQNILTLEFCCSVKCFKRCDFDNKKLLYPT